MKILRKSLYKNILLDLVNVREISHLNENVRSLFFQLKIFAVAGSPFCDECAFVCAVRLCVCMHLVT